jgi:quercetin dioxygenase-like cupin family protein/DNA-binding XRE family transcriptional regulator
VPVALLRIGERIRAERERRDISLRGLARSVGLSASLVSQIETGKCQPSVSTLYAITTALGISVQDVFGEPGDADVAEADAAAGAPVAAGRMDAGPMAASRMAGGPMAAGAAAELIAAGAAAGPMAAGAVATAAGASVVACPGGREVVELESGVTWERLGHVPGSHVDFLLVCYPPGGCSAPAGGLMRHPGTEYGYLTHGELVVTLGSRVWRLTPGDAVSFRSTTPHSYRNEGPTDAVGVWFVASD